MVFLSQPSECLDYAHVPPCLATAWWLGYNMVASIFTFPNMPSNAKVSIERLPQRLKELSFIFPQNLFPVSFREWKNKENRKLRWVKKAKWTGVGGEGREQDGVYTQSVSVTQMTLMAPSLTSHHRHYLLSSKSYVPFNYLGALHYLAEKWERYEKE